MTIKCNDSVDAFSSSVDEAIGKLVNFKSGWKKLSRTQDRQTEKETIKDREKAVEY